MNDDGWIDDYNIKDAEKFKAMTEIFEKEYRSAYFFAKKIGVAPASIFNWLNNSTTKFQTKTKLKIRTGFNLIDTVWTDPFPTIEKFKEVLQKEYKKKEDKKEIREEYIVVGLNNQTTKKRVELSIDELKDDSLEFKIKNQSSKFIFNVAKQLQKENEIEKSLKILNLLEERIDTFKYTHDNQIKHLKAILLSHQSINDWDGAIHVLRILYHTSNYHLKKPEILTLLASNYKRKALINREGSFTEIENLDMQLITSALALYEDAYEIKANNEKYYDAINRAYLYNIVDSIEIESADIKDTIELYNDLKKIWRVNNESWWEVSSEAEFLMLIGDLTSAFVKIDNFLENNRVKAFDINSTIRQLKLYIHFTQDNNAKMFLNHLEECLKYL